MRKGWKRAKGRKERQRIARVKGESAQKVVKKAKELRVKGESAQKVVKKAKELRVNDGK
ncbi:hypothetical protein [Cytobacillus kochii]|uniref:hypothetical protein n=1 Tax=Cytobacillus kochii TaxID=859143 RepID=UPI0012FD3D67|nr:hypothetical protein [Cytobacillus kochii]